MADLTAPSEQAAVNAVHRLVGILTGEQPDDMGIAAGVASAIGFAALSDISDAYIVKARGGTDAAGISWPPLKPETIAARKIGENDTNPSDKFLAGKSQAEIKRAKQDAKAFKRRESLVKKFTKQFEKKFETEMLLSSLPRDEVKRRAKARAEMFASEVMGKTKTQLLGFRNVEILRDTGLLLNSLTPGQMANFGPGMVYQPPHDQQIFEFGAGVIVIGTSVEYAAVHQFGSPDRNIPRRQFLPEPDQIPDVWWDNWLDAALQAITAGASLLIQKA